MGPAHKIKALNKAPSTNDARMENLFYIAPCSPALLQRNTDTCSVRSSLLGHAAAAAGPSAPDASARRSTITGSGASAPLRLTSSLYLFELTCARYVFSLPKRRRVSGSTHTCTKGVNSGAAEQVQEACCASSARCAPQNLPGFNSRGPHCATPHSTACTAVQWRLPLQQCTKETVSVPTTIPLLRRSARWHSRAAPFVHQTTRALPAAGQLSSASGCTCTAVAPMLIARSAQSHLCLTRT